MHLNHVGIINNSEEDALRFYRDVMGFKLTKEYVVPAELSEQIFRIPRDIKMFVFEKEGVKVEVFISPEYEPAVPNISHTGFLLEDLSGFVDKAGRAGVEHIIGKTAEKTVHFIRDFSGNLMEIKQK